MIEIYTDGSCQGNPGTGGWAAVINDNGQRRSISGRMERTTNNRMEILAVIKGLEAIPEGSQVTIYTDSQYVVNTMTRGWQRKANQDLWVGLDEAVERRRVKWEWVRGHAGNPGNEEADRLARREAGIDASPTASHDPALTHLDESGSAHMVDVGWKPDTQREAVARGSITMSRETLDLIKKGGFEKGDVLGVARVAGVMGAKRTPDLIPLCHPIPLDQVTVEFDLDEAQSSIHITATARAEAKTGVEMEALTAVAVAALTIYDMCKSADRAMRIEGIRLAKKTGGKSGDILLEE